jgi:diguanylate cyclase (GGDEF)-like protein/putative nucleotidyltransferase with HDIG domain
MSPKKLKFLFLLALTCLLAALCAVAYLPGLFSSDKDGFLLRAILLALACGSIFCLFFILTRFYERRERDARREEAERLLQWQTVADLRMSTIESLAIAIDAKDQTTHGHVRRTQIYAVELGKLLDVTVQEIEALKAAALLHDIGKLAVPDYILNKPGRLTAAEFEKMKVHAVVGADIVRRVNFPYPVEDAVRYHHERWDGTGYPSALKAEQIPLVARIVSVVDFYDSTRCDRPYRAGMTRDASLGLLRRMAGKHFDPTVVEVFVNEVERLDELISKSDFCEQVQSDEKPLPSHERAAMNSQPDAAVVRDASSGFRSIAEAQREVFALHEMSQTIGSSLNLRDTVALVTGKLNAIVPFDTCVIFVLDDKSSKAEPVHAAGRHEDFFSSRSVAVGEGITGWVIANARSMSDTPPELDLAGVPTEIASEIRCVISSPLLREDGSFGAITLYSTGAALYTAEHVRLLESVCLHASSALGNALMFEKTKESALTDMLTGLANARALQLMLERRIAESRRLDRESIAVLSIDVNNFKEINDELGHGVGDRLLASAAEVIKGQLREMDLLARYAGDEFVAVLPTATAEVAAMVAERIRTAVESHKFQVKTGRAVQIEISVGIGCYPSEGETADELILAATQNMRRKKGTRAFSSDSQSPAKVLNMDAYR